MTAPEQKVNKPSPVAEVQKCKDYFCDAVIMVIRQVKWEIRCGSNVIWQLFSSYKLQWDTEGLGCNGGAIPSLLKILGEGKFKVTDLEIVSIN